VSECSRRPQEGFGCDRVVKDKASGARLARPGLDDALSHLRAGNTLVVWKLDRLGRSVKGLVDLVNGLEARDVPISET